jgi:enoyl-CoA hydratase/carnithine racemase
MGESVHGPYGNVDVTVDEGVATVTICRPDVHNALDVTAMLDLDRAFDALALRRDVEVVVVTGAGEESFSSGADVGEYDSLDGDEAAFHRKRAALSFELARKARSLHAPTVAKINGYCIGAGLVLAMYCDLRIAGADAAFGLPTTDLGQIPGGGATYRLVELVGESAAKELVLVGDLIGADRADEMGLVTTVVEPNAVDEKVAAVVETVRDGGTDAVKAAKSSINAAADLTDRDAAFEEETERWWEQYDSEERRRLVAEFESQ